MTAKLKYRLALTMLVVAVVGAGNAQAQPWTTVGSTGTVDDGDLHEVSLSNGVAAFRSDAPDRAYGYVRYPVRFVEESIFADCADESIMRVTYSDNGPDSRVLLRLKRVEIFGRTTTLATFDSNTWESSANGGFRTNSIRLHDIPFDFDRNAYFIEAFLAKYGPTGNPKLLKIHLANDIDLCIPR